MELSLELGWPVLVALAGSGYLGAGVATVAALVRWCGFRAGNSAGETYCPALVPALIWPGIALGLSVYGLFVGIERGLCWLTGARREK